MWDDLSDESLMQRIARDDTGAFDALFLRHRRAVFSFTFRMLGDRATAEDLTQECFLRVWRARQRYQPAAAFRTWLFTIARRQALDELKKRQTRGTVLAAEMVEDESVPEPMERFAQMDAPNPQEIVMARELGRVMEAALRQLPEEYREAVILRATEGLSYEEMARVLDCPLGTVKSRLNAARKRLKEVALAWLGEKRT
jgi:RNA polymerase sigma-70 factor (ECF subfamily)